MGSAWPGMGSAWPAELLGMAMVAATCSSATMHYSVGGDPGGWVGEVEACWAVESFLGIPTGRPLVGTLLRRHPELSMAREN